MSKILIHDHTLTSLADSDLNLRKDYNYIWDFSYTGVKLETLGDADWDAIKRHQKTNFNTKWFNLKDDLPSEVLFYGLTSIPAAIHLGSLFESLPSVQTRNRHHITKSWDFHTDKVTIELESEELRTDKKILIDASGDVIVRIFTSHKIEEKEVSQIVPNALYHLEIRTKTLDEDILLSLEDNLLIARKWKEALDWICSYIPNVSRIHLFASVPVGLAFLLGAQISPTMHKPILTYQYFNRKPPNHHPAILIGQNQMQTQISIPAARKEILKKSFDGILNHFENNIKPFIRNVLQTRKADNWVSEIFPYINVKIPNQFSTLNKLAETDIPDSSLKYNDSSEDTDFYSAEERSWNLTESFLDSLHKEFPSSEDFLIAIRLFLFHETIHPIQSLRSTTSNSIGDYSRVLEIIDFQADVYAFLYEYSFSQVYYNKDNLRKSLLSSISTGIRTMWLFIPEPSIDWIEARRFYRLISWYWKFEEISACKDDTLEILTILFEKPVIDIRGVYSRIGEGRLELGLYNPINQPEIAVIYKNRLKQLANSKSLDLKGLLEVMRNKNHEETKNKVQSIFDHARS